MNTIANFTTTKNVLIQLKENDCDIKLSFKAEESLKCTKNPFEGFEVKNVEGDFQKIITT